MKIVNAVIQSLTGSFCKIGKDQAQLVKKYNLPQQIHPQNVSVQKDVFKHTQKLIDEFAPGLNEEMHAYAHELKVKPEKLLFYETSYLKCGCSQIALLPTKTEIGQTLLARNYDFSEEVDDLTMCFTDIPGKYKHMGFSMVKFGRCEGMNEMGLTISMSSAGRPVGVNSLMKNPGVDGLQFWIAIRVILENCKSIDEAKTYIYEMPIASNINFLIATKNEAAIITTFDGKKEKIKIDESSKKKYLIATNHLIHQKLIHLESFAMKNSKDRYHLLFELAESKEKISIYDLKKLLSTEYPKGLNFLNYKQFFGTLRSIIFNLNDLSADICFGSALFNKWQNFKLHKNYEFKTKPVKIVKKKYGKKFWELVTLD